MLTISFGIASTNPPPITISDPLQTTELSAQLRGVTLPADGTYELEFDIWCSDGVCDPVNDVDAQITCSSTQAGNTSPTVGNVARFEHVRDVGTDYEGSGDCDGNYPSLNPDTHN